MPPDPSPTTLPLTWVVGIALTFVGLWVPVILAMVAQARSFGAMQAKLDLVLKHVDSVDALRERITRSESWIEQIRQRIQELANHIQGVSDSTHPGRRLP